MREEKPEKAKVIDLAERRLRKTNASKQAKLGATPDGYFLYPETETKITTREALELARDIVKNYGLDSGPERFRAGTLNFGLDRRSLGLHRTDAKSRSIEELLKLLSLYQDSSPRRVTEFVLATAEELIKRLEPGKQG